MTHAIVRRSATAVTAPAPVQLIAPASGEQANGHMEPDPIAQLQTVIASLMVTASGRLLPQKLIDGKSWGHCSLSQFSGYSGIPDSDGLIQRAIRHATMARHVEVEILIQPDGSKRLHLRSTPEGEREIDSALAMFHAIRARW